MGLFSTWKEEKIDPMEEKAAREKARKIAQKLNSLLKEIDSKIQEYNASHFELNDKMYAYIRKNVRILQNKNITVPDYLRKIAYSDDDSFYDSDNQLPKFVDVVFSVQSVSAVAMNTFVKVNKYEQDCNKSCERLEKKVEYISDLISRQKMEESELDYITRTEGDVRDGVRLKILKLLYTLLTETAFDSDGNMLENYKNAREAFIEQCDIVGNFGYFSFNIWKSQKKLKEETEYVNSKIVELRNIKIALLKDARKHFGIKPKNRLIISDELLENDDYSQLIRLAEPYNTMSESQVHRSICEEALDDIKEQQNLIDILVETLEREEEALSELEINMLVANEDLGKDIVETLETLLSECIFLVDELDEDYEAALDELEAICINL